MNHYTRKNFKHTQSIGFLLAKARNLIATEIDVALRDLGVTVQQMGVIITLYRGDAHTPQELSTMLGIDTGLMTRMLDKLEKQGLVVRSRDAEDRRVVNLALSQRGAEIGDAIPDVVPPVLNRRLRSFTAEEFSEFERLVKKLLGE
jgi:DNA-binding MarR family transcriptional regulator